MNGKLSCMSPETVSTNQLCRLQGRNNKNKYLYNGMATTYFTPRSPKMMDYLLKFDEENDAEYKNSMIGMLKNLDKSERNVLETYITKDIGERPLLKLYS